MRPCEQAAPQPPLPPHTIMVFGTSPSMKDNEPPIELHGIYSKVLCPLSRYPGLLASGERARFCCVAFRFRLESATTMALTRSRGSRRLKGSLKIKYGLLTKSAVLAVFALYAILLGAASSIGALAGQHKPAATFEQQNKTPPPLSRLLSNVTITNNSMADGTHSSSTCDFADMGASTYPNHLLTCEQMKHGAIVLPILGCAFMFMGLAMVCDDFFVPALETISWRLDLTDDVAGK